jgi:hypothetical protein
MAYTGPCQRRGGVEDEDMNRYRLEVAVSFEPPVDWLRQARFADIMLAAYDSEVIWDAEDEPGSSVGAGARVRLSVETDREEEAVQTAGQEVARAAAVLYAEAIAVGEIRVLNAG